MFDVDDVRRAADAVIEKRGTAWCYADSEAGKLPYRDGVPECLYLLGAQPQCLIGEIYAVLLPDEVPSEGKRPFNQAIAYRFTREANILLTRWQGVQDACPDRPWSRIVAQVTTDGWEFS